jgi:hypothetical protein
LDIHVGTCGGHIGARGLAAKVLWLLYGVEVVLLEEVKHRSLGTITATPTCPSEAEEKDLLESDKLKVMTDLQKYQEETRAWRDPKVKLWEFDVGNLVLL